MDPSFGSDLADAFRVAFDDPDRREAESDDDVERRFYDHVYGPE